MYNINPLDIIINNARYTFSKGYRNWEEALYFASVPLLNQEIINRDYIEEMIASINEYGPYVVLDNEVAIPHLSNTNNCNKNGVSMMILDKPVDILGKKAKIIFVLASENIEGHIANIQQLLNFTMNKELINKLMNACNLSDLLKINSEI